MLQSICTIYDKSSFAVDQQQIKDKDLELLYGYLWVLLIIKLGEIKKKKQKAWAAKLVAPYQRECQISISYAIYVSMSLWNLENRLQRKEVTTKRKRNDSPVVFSS